MIAVAAPRSCFRLFRANPAQFFFDSLKLAPAIYEWLRRSKQAGPFIGTADTPNSFRKPFGPGWALVGDAGYHRDPVVFQGIADAFCHAELLVEALDKGFNAGTLSAFQQQRDKSVAPMYKLALEMARLESQNLWPMEMLEFLATHSEQRNRFLATLAGTLPIAEFQREIRTLFQTSRSSAPQQPRSQL